MSGYKDNMRRMLSGIVGILEDRSKTESEAISLASTEPVTIFYTTDTHRIVVGGVVYGGGGDSGSVLDSRTYSDITCVTNNDQQNIFMFGEVEPDAWSGKFYSFTLEVDGWVAGSLSTYRKKYRVRYEFDGLTMRCYDLDSVQSQYVVLGNSRYSLPTASGVASGKKILVGFDRRNDNNANNASFKATSVVRLVSAVNCSVTLFNELVTWGEYVSDVSGGLRVAPASNSTRFNGNMHTGDQNSDYNGCRLYNEQGKWKCDVPLYRNMILLKGDAETLIPVNVVDNGLNRTDKPLTTAPFDPHGEIFYYSSTATVGAGTLIAATSLWKQNLADLRYSFNEGQTLMSDRDVYLRAVPLRDGRARLSVSPICQSLPLDDDGMIYIYLGRAYDSYRIELCAWHPIYVMSCGRLQMWTGRDEKRLGMSVMVEYDGLWQLKDGRVYPVSHPDLSTQASVLPERMGTRRMYEVLSRVGDYESYPDTFVLVDIPRDCVIVSATAFNSVGQSPVATMYDSTDGRWLMKNLGLRNDGGPQTYFNDVNKPDYVLVKYYVENGGGGYYGGYSNY